LLALLIVIVPGAGVYLLCRSRTNTDYQVKLDFRPPSTLIYNNSKAQVYAACASADGQVFVFSTSLGELFISRPPFDSAQLLEIAAGPAIHVTLSHDGRYLAYSSVTADLVVVFDIETHQRTSTFAVKGLGDLYHVSSFLFLPNDQGLLLSTLKGLLITVDRDGSNARIVFRHERMRGSLDIPGSINATAYVCHNKRIALNVGTDIVLVDADSFREVHVLKQNGIHAMAALDDRILVASDINGKYHRWDCETGQLVRVDSYGGLGMEVLGVSRDGALLAITAAEFAHGPRSISLVDVKSNKVIATWGMREASIVGGGLLGKGEYVAVASSAGRVSIWRDVPELREPKRK